MKKNRDAARGPAPESGVSPIVHKNIQALLSHREEHERKKSLFQRVVDRSSAILGDTHFTALQALFVAGWLVANSLPLLRPWAWDPSPFAGLEFILTLEAIFIALFILGSQLRAGKLAERHAELALQVNLLTEHEITRLIELTDRLAQHAGVPGHKKGDLEELKTPSSAEAIIDVIEKSQNKE